MKNYSPSNLTRSLLIALIRFWQATLSPDHGFVKVFFPFGVCRYRPTCSEYTALQIRDKGALKGMLLGLRRVASCNSFYAGGLRKV